MKFKYLSLAAKNALIYFVLFIIGLAVSAYFVFSYSSKEILDLTESSLEHNADLIQLKFDTYMGNIEKDVEQLSESPILSRYLNEKNEADLLLLNEEFKALINSKLNYFQVRLLGVESGQEIVRVERLENSIKATDSSQFQNKKRRDYFLEIQAFPYDSIYYSKIDLNREYGKISLPKTPTIRVAKKLKSDLQNDLILIVNVNLNQLFLDLRNSIPNSHEFRMFNQEGHYLIHPDESQEFTFEFDLQPTYQNEYTIEIPIIAAQHELNQSELEVSKFMILPFKRQNALLYGIVSAQKAVVFANFYTWRTKVILVFSFIAIVFLLLAFISMRRQVRELKKITRLLMQFSQSPQPHKLLIERKDEIGQLARGFEKMSSQISTNHELLVQAKRDAEMAFKEKNEFLENMSHEIRNPLQSILGALEIIHQNNQDKSQQPYLNSLKFSTVQLQSLVTDVLDYGKIKKQQVKLHPEWINLTGFCNDLIAAQRFHADAKGISLELVMPSDLEYKNYYFDRTRLYQILNNLLSNAIKFTKEKTKVELVITQLEEGDLQFKVLDQGDGVPDQELKKILNREYTSNFSTGAGLGLSIVQELLTLHHSSLQIDSKSNVGSCFSFSLKLKHQLAAENMVTNRFDLSNIKVLVIEDDEIQMNWYQHALKQGDVAYFTAPDNIDLHKQFDLIISDCNFPEKHGGVHELSKQLANHLHPNGKIIWVTGEMALKVELNTEENLLIKPFKSSAFWQLVAKHVIPIKFGKPSFEDFASDYDHNPRLISNALNVLLKEWRRDKLHLIEAILNQDANKVADINHRINTTLRRLDLMKFETYLNQIHEQLLTASPTQLQLATATIRMTFEYYLKVIEKHS